MADDEETKSLLRSVFGSPQKTADQMEGATWPPLSHNSFVVITLFASVFLAMTVGMMGMAGHNYFTATQRRTTFEQLDLNLVNPALDPKNVSKFSDACFECAVNVVYDPDGKLRPGQNKIWRFKGQMQLTENARKRMQFPSGAFIGASATILRGNTDMTKRDAYFTAGARDGRGVMHFGNERRLSTWPLTDSSPTSAYSVVPATVAIGATDTTSPVCQENPAKNLQGSVYSVYQPQSAGGKYALCTCRLDTGGGSGSAPVEYCTELQLFTSF